MHQLEPFNSNQSLNLLGAISTLCNALQRKNHFLVSKLPLADATSAKMTIIKTANKLKFIVAFSLNLASSMNE